MTAARSLIRPGDAGGRALRSDAARPAFAYHLGLAAGVIPKSPAANARHPGNNEVCARLGISTHHAASRETNCPLTAGNLHCAEFVYPGCINYRSELRQTPFSRQSLRTARGRPC